MLRSEATRARSPKMHPTQSKSGCDGDPNRTAFIAPSRRQKLGDHDDRADFHPKLWRFM